MVNGEWLKREPEKSLHLWSLLSFCHFVILFIHLNEFLNDESNTSCDYKTLTGTTGNWTTEVFQRVRFTWRELSFARFAPWNVLCVCVCAYCAGCLCVLCVRVIVKEKILCMHVSHSNRCHCISDDIMRLMVVFLDVGRVFNSTSSRC